MSKVIVFDIGNSDVVVGFFDANILKCSLRIKSLKNENALYFEYRILNFMLEKGISKTDYTKGVVSSVVPSLTPYFVEFCNKFLDFEPILVNPGTSKLMKINIDNPEELGADLFVNALAAYSIYQKACIVVDFGTALTFTSVNSKGEILGVNIVPGIKTAIKSLFSDTSLLPQVKLEIPEKVIGKNSMHSIQSGILIGYEGLVKELIGKIKAEIGEDVTIVGTGGLSSVLTGIFPLFDVIDRELTQKGLLMYGNAYL